LEVVLAEAAACMFLAVAGMGLMQIVVVLAHGSFHCQSVVVADSTSEATVVDNCLGCKMSAMLGEGKARLDSPQVQSLVVGKIGELGHHIRATGEVEEKMCRSMLMLLFLNMLHGAALELVAG